MISTKGALGLCLLLAQTRYIAGNFQPAELFSENGRLDVTLTVDLLESLNGTKMAAAYNGATVGPTMRVKPGDTVSVTLENNLLPPTDIDRELYAFTQNSVALTGEEDIFNATIIYNRLDDFGNIYDPAYGYWGLNYMNLHFHGAEVSPSIENLDDYVGGGDSKTYEFVIPDDAEPGLKWYHNHIHGNAAHSYMSNLFGFFVVEGTDRDITKAPGVDGATEIFMLLSENLVNEDKSVPPFFPIAFEFDWSSAANGVAGSDSEYVFAQGETVLFRVASATVEPTIRLFIPGHSMAIVAYDGYPVPEPEEVDVVSLGGGGRVEFLVRFDEVGTFEMSRMAWGDIFTPNAAACMGFFGVDVYPCISYDIEQLVSTITVLPADPPATPSTEALIDSIELPGYSARLDALAAQESVATKVIAQQTGPPILFENLNLAATPPEGAPPVMALGINNRLALPHHIDSTVVEGTCETWTITSNPPNFEHPIHVHAAPFLVQQIDGVDAETPFWRDTLIIGHNATVHICFDRLRAGEVFTIHCHMPSHMDLGMLNFIEVIAAEDLGVETTEPPSSDEGTTVAPTGAPTSSSTTVRVLSSGILLFLLAWVVMM